MTHLVTGSKGFLGRHLVAALPGCVGVDLPECDVTQSPLSGERGFMSVFRFVHTHGPSTVWHLAALNGSTQGFYDRPHDVLDTQIRGTINVIDACVANGVSTLILFSSSEVFQEQFTPTPEDVPFTIPDIKNPRYSYALGKQAAEGMAWWSAIPKVIVIRPFNVYGDDQRPGHVIPDLRKRIRETPDGGEIVVHGNPSSSRAYCHVSDFVAGCMAIWKHHEKDEKTRDIYNVGNPDNFMTNQALVSKLLHDECRPDLRVTYDLPPAGSTHARCPDVRKLQSLGWKAEVKL